MPSLTGCSETLPQQLEAVRHRLVAPVLGTKGCLDPFEHVSHGLSTASSGYEYSDAQLICRSFLFVARRPTDEGRGRMQVIIRQQMSDLVSERRGQLIVIEQIEEGRGDDDVTLGPGERADISGVEYMNPERRGFSTGMDGPESRFGSRLCRSLQKRSAGGQPAFHPSSKSVARRRHQ